MFKNIAKAASLFIPLTISIIGSSATAETQNPTNFCNRNLISLETNNQIALSPNGDPAQCSDYYKKCDEYHCYECTVCDYGGPYCWEISENKLIPQNTNIVTASK